MIKYLEIDPQKEYMFRSSNRSAFLQNTHIHEYTELIYVRSGSITLFLEGKKQVVSAGHLLFIFPNQTHKHTKKTNCELWMAVFSNDFITPFWRKHENLKPQDPVLRISDNFAVIDALQKTDPNDTTRLSGLLLLLYNLLEAHTAFIDAIPSVDDIYNAALGYIYNNFKSDITLADMAKDLGYHEKYLSHALHTLTKKNFRSFLASYRINHAKKLLRTTEMPIAQIALESGFSALNTFNRVFKEVTKKTPSEYRKSKK